jgi:hypothetical protein
MYVCAQSPFHQQGEAIHIAAIALAPHVCQRREAVVTEHIDAENRHDPDATVATFSSSKASYDIPAFGEAGQVPDHDSILRTGLL